MSNVGSSDCHCQSPSVRNASSIEALRHKNLLPNKRTASVLQELNERNRVFQQLKNLGNNEKICLQEKKLHSLYSQYVFLVTILTSKTNDVGIHFRDVTLLSTTLSNWLPIMTKCCNKRILINHGAATELKSTQIDMSL